MNTNILRTVVLFIAIGLCYSLHAQQGDTLDIRRENGKVRFARFTVNPNSNRKMSNDTLFLKSILQAKPEDEFRLINEKTDELGITHKRFQQYYKGFKVENAQYLVHGKEGNIDYINGHFQEISLQTVEPTLNEQQALEKALEYVGVGKYLWEDSTKESSFKERDNNSNAIYYPKGELVIAKNNLNKSDSFKLSWKFSIPSLQSYNEQVVFVDAVCGKIIRVDSSIFNGNRPNSPAETMYSGYRTITCDFNPPNDYTLQATRETTPGKYVTIKTFEDPGDPPYLIYSNTSSNWTAGNWADFNKAQAALDAHWGIEQVLDYWSDVHASSNIIDSFSGYEIRCSVPSRTWAGLGWIYSAWVTTATGGKLIKMAYGGADDITYNPFTSIDIVAHEIGHSIDRMTGINLGLGNSESRSLSEGFNDIWGICVKKYVNKKFNLNKPLWLFCGEVFIPNNPGNFNCLRDAQNPKSSFAMDGCHANTYQGQCWSNIYTQSTVLSHWFYLLCEGGCGVNDKSRLYNVTGIGINKAEQIAFRTLTLLFSSAEYSDARDASIQAAIDLYGAGSPEVVSVKNAWGAVSVGAGSEISVVSVASGPLYILNGNPIWGHPYHLLEYPVTVDAGVTLTIYSNVYCSPNAKIIVKPGGKLIVKNSSKFTSLCSGEHWQGIEVWGDSPSLTPTVSNPGIVEINNATIEDAICGIRAGGMPMSLSTGGTGYGMGGGIISANGASFVNCQQAVYFAPSNNASYFNNCVFEINKPLNTTGYQATMVELQGVSGVKFTNCRFLNNTLLTPSQSIPPIGIYANNSSIKVGNMPSYLYTPMPIPSNGCEFSNLYYAVWLQNSHESSIYASRFNNNHIGVLAAGSNKLTVENNEFTIPSQFFSYAVGAYISESSLYKIENNKFTEQGLQTIGGGRGTGIVTYNTGTVNHFIRNNSFSGFCTACLAIGINSDGRGDDPLAPQIQGLVYQCNKFEYNNKDILVTENSRIRYMQTGNNILKATGNVFNNSTWNLYNIGTHSFNYRYLQFNNNHFPAQRYYSNYPKNLIGILGSDNNCCIHSGYAGNNYYNPTIDCVPLSSTTTLTAMNNKFAEIEPVQGQKSMEYASNGYNIVPINWEDSMVQTFVSHLEMHPTQEFTIWIVEPFLTRDGAPPTILERFPETDLEKQIVLYYELTNLKQQMDMLCYAALEILANDTAGLDMIEYRKWVGRFNTVESDYLLADLHLASGEFAEADSILQAMPAKFEELDLDAHQNYWDYFAVLQEYSLLGDGDTIPAALVTELVRLSANNDFVAVKAYSFGEMLFCDWRETHPREFAIHPACVCSPSSSSISQNNSGNNTVFESKINENQNQNVKNTDDLLTISSLSDLKAEITLKPNPTTGELKIESGELKIESVVVFDVVGKELFSLSTINNTQATLNIDALHNGMYFIKITTEDGMQRTKKIVKH